MVCQRVAQYLGLFLFSEALQYSVFVTKQKLQIMIQSPSEERIDKGRKERTKCIQGDL